MNEEFWNVRETWNFDQYYNAVILYSDMIDIYGSDLVRMVLLGEMWVKFPEQCAENGLTDTRTPSPEENTA